MTLKRRSAAAKGKKRLLTPINLLILLLQIVFIVALIQILRIMLGYLNADSSYDSLTGSMKEVTITIFPDETNTGADSETEAAGDEEDAQESDAAVTYTYSITVPDFDYLTSINADVIGWIQIPGTAVNYPIVQGSDNDYYLTHLYTGKTNSSGAIFLDSGTTLGLEDRNAIIFGHNMKNGSMFAALNHYTSSGYYSLHPYVVVTNLDGTRYIYDIFAVYTVDASEEAASSVYLHGFGADENFASYLEMVKGLSIYSTGVRVTQEDYIITLSTCQSANSSVRTIVQAVRR